MSDITKAIQVICDEKGLKYEDVLDAIQSALAAAYRKDFGNRQQNIKVIFDPELGGMKVWDEKEVVEDVAEDELEKAQEELTRRREEALTEGRELTEEETADLVKFNPKTQLMITAAKEINKKAKVGEILNIDLEVPGEFGRMAAQTAKQVVIQRLREAERNGVYDELKDQVGTLINGVIQRRDREGVLLIDLGKVTGTVAPEEQVQGEFYRPGAKMRFLILAVEMGKRGLEIRLSRSSGKMVETIFAEEIPEIASGAVLIKGVARDPGHRAKVAVFTEDETIDPIGACIGQRGSRINTIIEGLGGEKLDMIQYSDDIETYIKNSLSPAKAKAVKLDEATKEAQVFVAPDQFSLAIGRNGQNVRLASQLTGWRIDVVQDGPAPEAVPEAVAEGAESVPEVKEEIEAKTEDSDEEKEEKTEDKKEE